MHSITSVSRLASLGNQLTGTTNDLSATFAWVSSGDRGIHSAAFGRSAKIRARRNNARRAPLDTRREGTCPFDGHDGEKGITPSVEGVMAHQQPIRAEWSVQEMFRKNARFAAG